MNFAGQVAVVTGGSSGIGAELARQLADAGAKVAILALPDAALAHTTQAIVDRSGFARAVPVDVTQREGVHAAIETVTNELGAIDLLVLCAGITGLTTVESLWAALFEEIVRVNLLGTAYAIEAALPSMLQRRRGQIAAISSLSSRRGQPVFSGYCASKAAVSTLLEGLRIELRPYGIAVTTVSPGFVRTPMIAESNPPFVMEVEPAVRVILKAIAERRAEVNFPWPSALLMGASRWLPNAIYDRIAARRLIPLKDTFAANEK